MIRVLLNNNRNSNQVASTMLRFNTVIGVSNQQILKRSIFMMTARPSNTCGQKLKITPLLQTASAAYHQRPCWLLQSNEQQIICPRLTTKGFTIPNQRPAGMFGLSARGFAKGSKGNKESARKDKKKAQEKAQINEEFAGQNLDSIKTDFEQALDAC